jgi:hypothetical protein
MKRLIRFLAVVAVTGSLIGGFPTPSEAGGDVSLTVEKVVVGTVPPGTSFTVDLNCGTVPNEGATAITFDDEGNAQPPGSNVVTWGPALGGSFDCTPTEQAPAGATVTYSCTDSTQATTCDDAGPQTEPIVVSVGGTGSVTLTVTNSYPDPPPAPTTQTTDVRPTIGVAPTFTG